MSSEASLDFLLQLQASNKFVWFGKCLMVNTGVVLSGRSLNGKASVCSIHPLEKYNKMT